VRFIALIHNNPAAWQALSQDERDEHNRDADAYLERLTASGELVAGAVVLAHPSNARTVRVREGVPAVTDGPFAEGKEHLAGYYLLECESLERATEIVTGDPSARFFAVEVRPVMHMTAAPPLRAAAPRATPARPTVSKPHAPRPPSRSASSVRRTTSLPEQRYLEAKAARLDD
jgi:hypothetical protein